MIHLRHILLCMTLAGMLQGAEIRLTDGRVLTDARVISEAAATVTLMHKGGMLQVDKALLPPDLAARYSHDAAGVAAEKAAAEERRARLAAEAGRRAQAAPTPPPAPAPPPEIAPEPESVPPPDPAKTPPATKAKPKRTLKVLRPDMSVPITVAGPTAQTAEVATKTAAGQLRSAVEKRVTDYIATERFAGGKGHSTYFAEMGALTERELTGWDGRREFTGTATYRHYGPKSGSEGSLRKLGFVVQVVLSPEGLPVVVSFEERR